MRSYWRESAASGSLNQPPSLTQSLLSGLAAKSFLRGSARPQFSPRQPSPTRPRAPDHLLRIPAARGTPTRADHKALPPKTESLFPALLGEALRHCRLSARNLYSVFGSLLPAPSSYIRHGGFPVVCSLFPETPARIGHCPGSAVEIGGEIRLSLQRRQTDMTQQARGVLR
jgi:hypothetical protein